MIPRLLASGRLTAMASVQMRVLADTAAAELAPTISRIVAAVSDRVPSRRALSRLGGLGACARDSFPLDDGLPSVTLDDLGWPQSRLDFVRTRLRAGNVVVIGRFDQDGFLLSDFEPVNGVPNVSADEYVPRARYALELVAMKDERIGVRKSYAGKRAPMLREMLALLELGAAGCSVPTLLAADVSVPSLTMSFVPGEVLREALVRQGAQLRDRDLHENPAWRGLTLEQIRLGRVIDARSRLRQVVDDSFTEDLFGLLRTIHRVGFCRLDIKYGNIVINERTGKPVLLDLENAIHFGAAKWLSRPMKDYDIDQFNVHFNDDRLTRRRLRKAIECRESSTHARTYAPSYVGSGLRIGQVTNLSAGYGRWQYLLRRHLPPWKDKTVLDLGANNAYYCLEMLRDGAASAVALEMDAEVITEGQFIKKAFEWCDDRTYNLAYTHANIADLPKLNLGAFDIVMALCSLYYLDDSAIIRVVQHVCDITQCFVVQCNTERDIGRASSDTYRKASLEYTVALLSDNGFPVVKIVAPMGYERPLVIGRKLES